MSLPVPYTLESRWDSPIPRLIGTPHPRSPPPSLRPHSAACAAPMQNQHSGTLQKAGGTESPPVAPHCSENALAQFNSSESYLLLVGFGGARGVWRQPGRPPQHCHPSSGLCSAMIKVSKTHGQAGQAASAAQFVQMDRWMDRLGGLACQEIGGSAQGVPPSSCPSPAYAGPCTPRNSSDLDRNGWYWSELDGTGRN